MNQYKQSESLLESAGQTYEYLRALTEVKIDQAKLELVERSSKTVSALITLLVIGTMALLALIFAFLSLAIYLGTLTGSFELGFGLVAGFILLLAGGLYLLRRSLITNPIISFIIKKIYE
ncbi:MAG: phage holin family protein [Phaeodactylibacter sp.]|nr:phage holin family protein [Phaeodactylibacter sp.]